MQFIPAKCLSARDRIDPIDAVVMVGKGGLSFRVGGELEGIYCDDQISRHVRKSSVNDV